MIKRFYKDIPYYEFSVFQKFRKRAGLRHAIFTRRTDIDNPSSIQNILHTKALPISFANQLHGAKEWVIKKQNYGIREGDILVSALKNVPLVIRIADCGSIQLFDPKRNVIANIHAGWRGLAKKVIERAVHIMAEQFDSKSRNIVAGISPMLGSCCSYFSDPKNELPAFLHPYILKSGSSWPKGRGFLNSSYSLASSPGLKAWGFRSTSSGFAKQMGSRASAARGKGGECPAKQSFAETELVGETVGFPQNKRVDLWAIAEDQLRACGVLKENIENPRMCTFCLPQEFHSYRRDKKLSGRFATAIMLS